MVIANMETNVHTLTGKLNWDNTHKARILTTKDQGSITETCLTLLGCLNHHRWWIWVRWTSSRTGWWCRIKWDSPISRCLWILISWVNKCGRIMQHLSPKTVISSSPRWCLEGTNLCKWINQWTICKDTETCLEWTLVKIQFQLNSTKLSRCLMVHNKLLKALSK